MVKDTHRKIAEMSWDEFEGQLGGSTRAGKSRTISDNAMREYFGDQQFERLKPWQGAYGSYGARGQHFGAISCFSTALWAPS